MRYFYCPPTCSLGGMAALEIAGAKYEPVAVDLAGDRAELRSLNILGKVPTLEADGVVITDTVAIIYWLARQFPAAGLLPTDETATALALSRMAWLGNSLHIVRRRFLRPMMFSADATAHESIRRMAVEEYVEGLRHVNTWIGDPQCSLAVRVYALVFYHWALMDGISLDGLDRYSRVVRELAARTDVRRGLERHKSPLLTLTSAP